MSDDLINPDAFELVTTHGPLRFGAMVIINDRAGELRCPRLPALWTVSGDENLRVVDENGRPRTPGRPETIQARKQWMRKHFLPKIWGLKGEEAVNAFRKQYGGITGKPQAVGLRFSEVRSAWDAHRKRLDRRDRSIDQAHAPPQAFQYMLLAMWDYVFSHLSAPQIHDYFPFKQWPAVSEDAIYQAVNRYDLPWTPGPARIDVKTPLKVKP